MTMFHKNLNRFMEAKGWKASNLLSALTDLGVDVSFDAVKRWLSGDNEPRSSDMYAAIARALGTTPNVLLSFDAGEDAGDHGADVFDTVHGGTASGVKA